MDNTSIDKQITDFWQNQQLVNPMILVFYGIGSGHHLKHYFENPHPQNKRVIIIEKSSEHFKNVAAQHDFKKELDHPHIHWLIGETADKINFWAQTFFKDMDHMCFSGSIENVMWPPSLNQDGPYYVEAAKALKDGSHHVVTSMSNNPEDGFYGLVNFLSNIPGFKDSLFFDGMTDVFKDKPGIVVSTGPSLNSAMPYLKAIKDKAVFFAVDSAVPVLLEAGITPHFIACLERVVDTSKLTEILPELPNTHLVALPLIHRKTINAFKGPKLYYLSKGFNYNWLFGDDIPSHTLGYTASTLAFKGLDLMGCDPLILVGQDLSFEPGSGKSHADGALPLLAQYGEFDLKAAEEKNKDENKVMGNSGQLVQTNEIYRMFADKFYLFIHESGKKCYNAIFKQYGMKMQNAHRIDPSEIADLCSQEFNGFDFIDKHLKDGIDSKWKINSSLLQSNLQQTHKNLKQIQQLTISKMEEISICNHEHPPSFIDKSSEEKFKQLFNHLETTIEQTVRQNTTFNTFLWPFVMLIHVTVMTNYYQLMGDPNQDFGSKIPKALELFQTWFTGVHLWASRTVNLMEKHL